MKRIVSGLVLLGLAASLAACGNGGGFKFTPPPAAAAKFEDQFGSAFGVAFRADANSEPRDLAAGDVIAPSLTAEPVPFQGG